MKKFGLAMTAMLLAVSMTACASNPSDSGEQKLRIGIIQPAEHAALDSAREGFVDALADHGYVDGETIEIDYQNAQGDSSALLTISQRFVGDDCDLVLAIGTGAAQSIASQTSEIPVLITAVTDPVDAGLVQSDEGRRAPMSPVPTDMNPMPGAGGAGPGVSARCADRGPALHQQRGRLGRSRSRRSRLSWRR